MNTRQNDLIVYADSNQRITYANQAYCDAFGIADKEVVGYDFKQLIHPEDINRVRDSLELLKAPPNITHHEERAKTVHGWKWFAWTVKADIDGSGNISGIKAVGRDVTQVKQQQEEFLREKSQIEKVLKVGKLANKELKLETVLKNVLEGTVKALNASIGMIFLIDDSTGFLNWGASVGLSEAFINDFREQPIQPAEGLSGRIARTGQPIYIQTDSSHDPRIARLIIIDENFNSFIGVPITALEQIVGVMNILTRPPDVLSEDDLSLCAAIGTNVGMAIRNAHLFDKSKKTEEALKESEQKYRNMMEVLIDPAYICSRDFVIEYMNPAMIEKVGYDATGEICHKVMHGLDEKCQWCIHEKVMQGEFIRAEVLSPLDNKIYHGTSSPISHIPGSTSKLTVFRDITEIKKLEERLQQAQKMETIGNLAGGIAHDFNNLLFPIIGMSELLLEDLSPGSHERENAEEILKAGKRGSDLVKQILTFSRQSEHKMMPTRIQKVLKEVIRLSRSTIPTYIEMKQDIQQNCGMIMADSSQIHQIGMNIITNAYHAVEDAGGTISVILKQIVIEGSESPEIDLSPGPYAILSISDTGHGISQELVGKIFDPYFTTKEQGKGTGLGLAVVYGIVKKHGGIIKVYSKIGKGSTFDIYLPLMKKSIDTESVSEVEDYQGEGEWILLVDDEESVAKLEKQMLERMGYKVTYRLHSIEAFEAFRTRPSSFDLVVTDMSMPNMSGDQLAKKLKSIRPDVPVIICTGFSERLHEDDISQKRIDGILMKPILKSDMAKTVRKVLDEAKA